MVKLCQQKCFQFFFLKLIVQSTEQMLCSVYVAVDYTTLEQQL